MLRSLALWLALSAPAFAQDAPPTADFTNYTTAMTAGQRGTAADALLLLLDDPAQVGLHAEAWVKLGGLMEEYNLHTAALHCYAEAAMVDIAVASPIVTRAIELAEQLGDESRIGLVFADNLGADVDADTRSKMALMASRELLRREELGAALSLLVMVDAKSAGFADAELLRGVLMSMQGRHEEAISPMLTAQAIGREQDRGEHFDTVVHLNVARTYYGAENWAQAIYWFKKVPRSSEYWPEATYERAWALFRADDMRGSLASLLNHEAPNFQEWYFPEADLLRAYGEFMMCKFADASKSMDGFVERYEPMRLGLDADLSTMSPKDGWADGLAVMDREDTKLPHLVLRSLAYEARFAESRTAVEAADAELGRLTSLSTNKIGVRAKGWITTRRDEIIASEGQRVLDRAAYSRTELAEMLNGIELTRLDLLNLEAEMYQRASVTGELEFGDKIGKLRDMRKSKKGMNVWPFQGEFWADEMGWYQIDARPDCPATMSRGDEGKDKAAD
jgi:tetratricopeptide (TPR) repeat protein